MYSPITVQFGGSCRQLSEREQVTGGVAALHVKGRGAIHKNPDEHVNSIFTS